MQDKTKVAGIQMEPILLEKEKNVARCIELTENAASNGAQLIVFPECTVTGYVYKSLGEAIPVTESIPGPSTEKISEVCRKLNVYVVIGLLENKGTNFYNAAVLLGPSGLIGKYRKLHLPFLGVDRFLNHGDLPLVAYDTEIGKIGMGICYDARFPEHARVLALQGAEIIVYPTNLAELSPFTKASHTIITRAFENLVFCMSVNRVGFERGFKFAGRSRIADFQAGGSVLAEGKPYEEDSIYAEIEPAKARNKYTVLLPGEFETDFVNDRRPEYYGLITQPLSDNSRIR